MTDGLTRAYASYAVGDVEVPPQVRREAWRRTLDSIGVAFAALSHPGPEAVRRYAEAAFPDGGTATVWGTGQRVPLEVAALVNGVAVRCLDYNDNYFSLNGGHPSDIIGGLIAVAEARGNSGAELLDAIAIGYEAGAVYNDSISMRHRGWDQTNMTGIAAWAGVARLLHLTQEQAEDALAMTVVPRVGLGQARYGNVPMWKGFAGPDAVRFAVYAGLLAEAGVQGPFEPFEGKRGFLAQLTGGVIDHPEGLAPLYEQHPPSGILRGNMKAWPLGSVAQSAVSAAVQVHRQLQPGEEMVDVTITTFDVSIDVMGSPEKYAPPTRETADHSLPYLVVAALRDGKVDESSFEASSYADPEMHRFLQSSVHAIADPELSARYPAEMPAIVEVTTSLGRTLSGQVDSAPGSVGNPFSDEELNDKFRICCAHLLGERTDEVIEAVAGLESAPGVRHLVDLLAVPVV